MLIYGERTATISGSGAPAAARVPVVKVAVVEPKMETDFEKLVRENARGLFNLAYHALGNREEAEELVQEVFLEAYKALPGFRGDASAKNWLYRIAVNVLADYIGAKKRRPATSEMPVEGIYGGGTRAADAPSAESEYIRESEMASVRSAVMKLPAKYRAVFVLNAVEGYSHVEIAEMLGISQGAARVMRLRAAKMIRNELAKQSKGKG